VVKVTDNDDNLRGRFLISAGSLYYFRKNAKEPSRRYSWRQLIEMIEEHAAKPPGARRATPAAARAEALIPGCAAGREPQAAGSVTLTAAPPSPERSR
jgi:hypothetical protein